MLKKLNHPNTIIVVGRAHSGTRVIPEVLKASGVFMGEPQNIASDLLPVDTIYEACRIFGEYVTYKGKHQWDFSKALTTDIPPRFIQLLEEYLLSLIESESEYKGWKIPNNTLIYPWLVRLLPNATFIYWVRHPEGSCSKMTGVDRLEDWNIPCKKFLLHEWNYKIRVVSWKYHYDIIAQTPTPKRFLTLKFEDYVLHQEQEKKKLENLLNIPLQIIPLNKAKAKPFEKNLKKKYKIIASAMDALGYE